MLIHAKPATRRSWDLRPKQGFYIGPALNSYHCFKLVKMGTKSQVISDTVKFRHAYCTIPAPSTEDKIAHGVQAIANALTDTPLPTTISQLDALTNLRDLFKLWRLLGPPLAGNNRGLAPSRLRVATPVLPPTPGVRTPRVGVTPLPAWLPFPLLASTLHPQHPDPAIVTPRCIVFANDPPPRVDIIPPPRVTNEPSVLPALPMREPIAHQTRSRASTHIALFAGQIPTPKSSPQPACVPLDFSGLCHLHPMTSSNSVDHFALLCQALSILDPVTGEFLEHRQLCCDPWYKPMWDMLYENELGHLCQGIRAGTTLNTKQVTGTNTFFLIGYNDIPVHKCKQICHTLVVCEVHPEKDNPNCILITIGGSQICYPGDVGTNTASLELVKILLNSVLSRKGARFSTIDLKNFYLDTPMPDLECVCIKMLDIPDKFILE